MKPFAAGELVIRPVVVAKVLLLDSLAALILVSFGPALILLTLILSSRPSLAERIRSLWMTGEALCFLLILAALLGLLFQTKAWNEQRSRLFEGEQYLILLILAVHASILFGCLSYVISRCTAGAYAYDAEVLKASTQKTVAAAEDATNESRAIVEALTQARSQLAGKTEGLVTINESRISPDIVVSRDFLPPAAGLSVSIEAPQSAPSGRGPVLLPHRGLELKIGGRIIRVDPYIHVDPEKAEQASRLFSKLLEDSPTVDDLVAIIDYRISWEERFHLKTREAELARARSRKTDIGLPLFIYQSVMSLTGSELGYAKPANLVSRSAVLIFSFLKFLFFGIFVVLAVKNRDDSSKSLAFHDGG